MAGSFGHEACSSRLRDKNKNILPLPPQPSKSADASKKHLRRKPAFLQLRQQEVGCCRSHAALLYVAPVHVGETGNVITPDRKTNLFPRNLALKRIDRPPALFLCCVDLCAHPRSGYKPSARVASLMWHAL